MLLTLHPLPREGQNVSGKQREREKAAQNPLVSGKLHRHSLLEAHPHPPLFLLLVAGAGEGGGRRGLGSLIMNDPNNL